MREADAKGEKNQSSFAKINRSSMAHLRFIVVLSVFMSIFCDCG
jgi:hypothetical protein